MTIHIRKTRVKLALEVRMLKEAVEDTVSLTMAIRLLKQ